MTAFRAIVRVTILQLAGGKRAIGFSVLAVVPAALLLVAARAREFEGLDTDLGALLVAPFFSVIIPLTALILGGAALGDERRDKTLSFLVLRPISRWKIAAGKALACSVVSSGFAALGALALCLAWVVMGGSMGILPAIVAGSTIACVIYSSAFVLLGNVTSRPTLVGLGYILFVESFLTGELPRLAWASPWRIGLGATLELMPGSFPARALLGALGEWVPSVSNALIAGGATALVTVAICTLLLLRTDAV